MHKILAIFSQLQKKLAAMSINYKDTNSDFTIHAFCNKLVIYL